MDAYERVRRLVKLAQTANFRKRRKGTIKAGTLATAGVLGSAALGGLGGTLYGSAREGLPIYKSEAAGAGGAYGVLTGAALGALGAKGYLAYRRSRRSRRRNKRGRR